MDWNIVAVMASLVCMIMGVITMFYTFLRNFKADIIQRADEMDRKIFFLATGRTLEDAILESKKKEK